MKALKNGHLILLKDSHALENEPHTLFTKINLLAFGLELVPISNVESIFLFWILPKRYITLF